MAVLTVCAITNDTSPRFAATLGEFKRLGAEIVVAVDSRVPEADTMLIGRVADNLCRYEYAPPIDRPLGWLHARCHGEWILRLDSDEVPSTRLLDQLGAGLLRRRDVHQYPIPRRWLYPDVDHWIPESPWWPDYQFRLARNDPAALWFPGSIHSSAYPTRPAQYLESPLYHLDLLLKSSEQRRAKVEEYAKDDAAEGTIADSLFYLPENHVGAPPADVPEEDRKLLSRMISAAGSGRRIRARRRSAVTGLRDEIDAFWELLPMPASERRAQLTLMEVHPRFRPGARTVLHLRVENRGARTWPPGPLRHPQVMVSYRWLDSSGQAMVADGIRSPLTAALPPAGAQIVPVTIDAPAEDGRYTLQLDLVHEGIAWFGSTLDLDVDLRR